MPQRVDHEVLVALQGPLQMAKDLTEASMGGGKDRDDCTPEEIRARGVWHALHYLERRLTSWDELPADVKKDLINWERQTDVFKNMAKNQEHSLG